MNKYEDIINLPHYEPIYHSRMSIDKRAGQFAPFAALTGYDEEIEETARLTTRKHILDEESVDKLKRTGKPFLGLVLNGVDTSSRGSYYYKGYGDYYGGYDPESQKKGKKSK